MNLTKMFKIQKELDERIVKEKDLKGVDLLDKKILSLQVELGELANELPEVFKFWSNKKNNYKKALEEYCDCLHFILSIGLEIKEIQNKPVENFNYYSFKNPFGITQAFTDLMREFPLTVIDDEEGLYIRLFCKFIGLGEMLGFTWQEVEQAYYKKNEINHERQENGY